MIDNKVSAKEFFAILGLAPDEVLSFEGTSDELVIVTYDKDEDGNFIDVGPSFARHRKTSQHRVVLVKPGRPEGTTIANGASPKTRRKGTIHKDEVVFDQKTVSGH